VRGRGLSLEGKRGQEFPFGIVEEKRRVEERRVEKLEGN